MSDRPVDDLTARLAAVGDDPVVLTGATVVTGAAPGDGAVIDDGWVAVAAGRITAVGSGPRPPGPVIDVGAGSTGGPGGGGRWLIPGFVDLHCHGGGGHGFGADPAANRAAAAFHRAHGTTTMLASLATAPLDRLAEQAGVLAAQIAGADGLGPVVGIHLEGPFLAHARCGAHDPTLLRAPDRGELDALLQAGAGHVAMVTVAPELPGALALIDALVADGVIAAVGHTDATYEQAAAAFDRGATVLTHAGNAMAPFHHRAPGPVAAACDATRAGSGVGVELIVDGVHLHDATVRAFAAAAGDGTVLVTDAMAAAGAGDGPFRLGGRAVTVTDGVARTADGALAGSTLTMAGAVARAVGPVGLAPAVAVRAATAAPARLLGLAPHVGTLTPGTHAHLTLLHP